MPNKRKKFFPKKRQAFFHYIIHTRFFLLLRFIVMLLFIILFLTLLAYHLKLMKGPISRQDPMMDEKQEFLTKFIGPARENQIKYGILPSITLAQAILESNWGKSELSTKYNNYFGIKSFKETEKRTLLPTSEFYHSKMHTVQDYFRVYDSLKESADHHGLLIGTAPRYTKVISAKDYKEASQELYKASYSTDPQYPDKLIQIIETYHLDEYDTP